MPAARWLAAIAVISIVGPCHPAFAIDPECVSPPPLTEWPCEDGDCRYCSSLYVGGDGTGYLMTCVVVIDGNVFQVDADLEPGVVVTVPVGPLRFAHSVTVQCTNEVGPAEVGPLVGRFPPAAPERPALLD